jgi:hypothetical protein
VRAGKARELLFPSKKLDYFKCPTLVCSLTLLLLVLFVKTKEHRAESSTVQAGEIRELRSSCDAVFCRSPGYGLALVAETTTGCIISTEATAEVATPSEDRDEGAGPAPEALLPEDIGARAAKQLLEEIRQGGVVDSTHQVGLQASSACFWTWICAFAAAVALVECAMEMRQERAADSVGTAASSGLWATFLVVERSLSGLPL